MSKIGIVAIGRNEGERLRRCLAAVAGRSMAVVYVDSGSSDGSIGLARAMGVDVVELDLSVPFSAARARNEGFERLVRNDPDVTFVQFVDGDCELAEGWLEQAARTLRERPEAAIVCGRRRERFPEQTVYNHLADLEWEMPAGLVDACGGDAMIRVEAFQQAGGYNPAIIAGEEPELCVRLRQNGWKILCIQAEMTLHDMAMTRFRQWWRRSVRAGHAYAEGAAIHGRPPERHFVRQTRSALFWGLLVPLLALGLAWPTWGLSLGLLVGYPLLYQRTRQYYATERGWPLEEARLYAAWVVLAKFPQASGVLRYGLGRIFGKPQRVIDYKGAKLAETASA
jgi:GT2 family glycosyltransferase